MEFRNIVDTQEVTIQGKRRKFQTLKPIATAVAELKGEDAPAQGGENGNGNGNTGTGGDNGGGGGGNTGSDDQN